MATHNDQDSNTYQELTKSKNKNKQNWSNKLRKMVSTNLWDLFTKF